MNKYFYARIDRRDFGDLLSEEGISQLNIKEVSEIYSLETPVHNSLLSVWSQDPGIIKKLPEVLICQDGSQNDWAAWITTFAVRIRPFSAYMRLMTHTEFQRTMIGSQMPNVGPLIWPATGIILGEVLVASGLPDKALETLSATAFTSTLSFVMCRTAMLNANYKEWLHLIDMWNSTRSATQQKTRAIESASIARVCTIILDALGYKSDSPMLTRDYPELIEACRYLLKSPHSTLSSLFGNHIFADVELMMRGSREDRVRAFEEFIYQSDGISVSKSEIMSFMLGYLASRIAPGTIRHSSVLSSVTKRYPTAMLWYGFCAGFAERDINMPDSNKRNSIDFPSSARRVIRELLRTEPIVGTPTCDIGYLELIALSRTSGDPLEGLIKTSQSSAIVELLPGVCTSVSVSAKPQAKPQDHELRERQIISSIGKQIERLRETYNDLLNIEKPSKDEEQLPLFPTRRKKKSYTPTTKRNREQ